MTGLRLQGDSLLAELFDPNQQNAYILAEFGWRNMEDSNQLF